MLSNTLLRAEARPVSAPFQYGEDADSARKCGTYWVSALTIGMAFSGARTPTCTWTPKICSRRAGHCIRSNPVRAAPPGLPGADVADRHRADRRPALGLLHDQTAVHLRV